VKIVDRRREVGEYRRARLFPHRGQAGAIAIRSHVIFIGVVS
jgi:hypothetical protein